MNIFNLEITTRYISFGILQHRLDINIERKPKWFLRLGKKFLFSNSENPRGLVRYTEGLKWYQNKAFKEEQTHA